MCNLYSKLIMPNTIRSFFEDMGLDLTKEALISNYRPGYVGADSDGPIVRRKQTAMRLNN